MARFNLKAAQNAALMALGEHGESVIANLDAVGLVIVRKADLPREAKEGRLLHDVRLHLPDGWTDPYHVTVTGGGLEEPVTWGVEFAAISTVREAAALQRTLGYQVNLRVDEQAGLITEATAAES
ncbi:hypothetical protein SAMN04488058_101264 [Deinococcus reticulitermitis]|uniref:Uncharacterized protein n=1 Tax=Deinococcus reticulitermitis TaxID=856736 RepID=A0A1H6SDJ3_9DEIO|nr:hypothetical protein [Deinococcus reticulitermitis]SEI65919.1 hypothetical protein SAMN04488058_101264 [Deinococcus reticulitermitis]